MAQEYDPPVDPVFKSSLRELKWIFVIWLVHFVWVVGYCYAFGYLAPKTQLTTVIGMPSWVFWGIAIPWICATAFTVYISLFVIRDQEFSNEEEQKK